MLRILCIHGYHQNAATFKDKLGGLRKMLRRVANLVFISASLKVPENDFRNEHGVINDGRGWWFSRSDNYFRAIDHSEVCFGFEESINLVEKAFSEEGPFDGILGFSQGAAFVAILCSMQQRKELNFNFDFAILVAGFKSRCLPHVKYFNEAILLPTLHVFGETDSIIGCEMSEELLEYFKDPALIKHTGGHYVPASSIHKKGFIEFLEERIKSKEAKEMNSEKRFDTTIFPSS